MKNTFLILLSTFLLCGCSDKNPGPGAGPTENRPSPQQATQAAHFQQSAPSALPAIDLVKPGQDVAWSNGYVLHVDSRDGASLSGIRLTYKAKDGQVTTTTSDKGTISKGPAIEDYARRVYSTNVVRIVLENARAQRPDGTVQESKEARFTLYQ